MMELRVDGWRKGIRFSSAHITPEHKKCGRLHGHTYAIHLRMRGDQDEWGIVLDFGIISDTLKQIADEIDHLVLVPTRSNHYSELEVDDDQVRFRVQDPYTGEPKRFTFPRQDCALLDIPSTTAEDLAKHIHAEFLRRTRFPTATAFVEIGVDEGYGKGAWYHAGAPPLTRPAKRVSGAGAGTEVHATGPPAPPLASSANERRAD